MGEEKSNSDNGNRINKTTNKQDEVNNYVKKIINTMNEQFKNTNESESMQ